MVGMTKGATWARKMQNSFSFRQSPSSDEILNQKFALDAPIHIQFPYRILGQVITQISTTHKKTTWLAWLSSWKKQKRNYKFWAGPGIIQLVINYISSNNYIIVILFVTKDFEFLAHKFKKLCISYFQDKIEFWANNRSLKTIELSLKVYVL